VVGKGNREGQMSRRLEGLLEEFVKCRSWGHEWDSFMPLRRRAAWGTLLSLRCARCGMERHDTIDHQGDLSARQYKAPMGYRLVGTTQGNRATGAELRLEVLRRMRKGAADNGNKVARLDTHRKARARRGAQAGRGNGRRRASR
jgi:hypothetical protein